MSETAATEQTDARHPFIERRSGISGGKPVIVGTRIRVSQIALEYERMGWIPDEIADAHPHLTLTQAHAALAYYYDHIAEIDADLKAVEQVDAEMRKLYPSKL
jgi:uncharacterized protein (DUF433 family)